MENQLFRTDRKSAMIIEHAAAGMAEINNAGDITRLNPKGQVLLQPICIAHSISDTNLYPLLELIAPAVLQKIAGTGDDAGAVISNETYSFFLSFGGEKIERHFNFTVIKICSGCIIVSFDDITRQKQKAAAIRELQIEKSVSQGKFEIASNILHDVGNALVGFGAYINRIKTSLSQTNPENQQKLADFFSSNQEVMTNAFGEAKAGAIINLLNNLTVAQKVNQETISKSITEQLHIISHIQDILNIQRQYANGHESAEKVPVNLRSVINDCMSMITASIEKRGIKVTIHAPEKISINGDRTRLMQVILNILKNSIEAIDIYAPEKNITITITTPPGFLLLTIGDNGHGFDEKTGAQLFERGFTTKAAGSGIGLISCRSIIESHEGTITISSEGFGKGALTSIQFNY